MKHTPEPWIISDEHAGLVMSGNAISIVIANCGSPESQLNKANAARIVACVNACQGLPLDELQQFKVQKSK